MNIWKFVNDNTYDSPDRQIKLLVDKLIDKYHVKDVRVLDAGGELVDRSRILSELGDVTVIDLAEGPNVDLVGDLHKLPINKSLFGVVAMFMVLEHLHDPLIAIKECQRVLKRRGYLIATTVQYWHTHNHPCDYYRYTKSGLIHLLESSRFKVKEIWSIGGPFLVIYHVIELNLPSNLRKLFILTCPIFNFLDSLIFEHEDTRENPDSLGWAFIAQKT